MTLNGRTEKENVAHLHIRGLLSGKKNDMLNYMQMLANRQHYPEWDNPDPKIWIL